MSDQTPLPRNAEPTDEKPAALEWAAARGEKWRDHLAGMEAMVKPVDEPLLRALRLDEPCRIADIGCGGGATSLEILRRAPAGSVVHGFDISSALIDSARTRIPSGQRAAAFNVADVATAPVPPELYHRLVSRFGIMFFDDPSAAFANLARWLVPGGRFAFAAWGPLPENPWMTTVRDAVAEIVDVPRPGPVAPGPFRYGAADILLTLLQQSGFSDLNVTDWRGALEIGGGLPAAEAADFALASFSNFGQLLADAGAPALDNAHRLLTARFFPHQQDEAVRLDACVHILTGTRRP